MIPTRSGKAPYLLGRDLRKKIATRLNRRPAFTVKLSYRKLIRNIYAFMSETFPNSLEGLHILPVSSIDCVSETRFINDLAIIILDVEQSNFFDFVCVREFATERPIFHYNEYAIRISELLYSLGDVKPALRMAQMNEGRLIEYSSSLNAFPDVPRPQNIWGLETVVDFLELATLSFVLGHEIGHCFLKRNEPLAVFLQIENLWRESDRFEDGDHSWPYFITPNILQRFDANGLASGNAVLSTQMMSTWSKLERRIIEESQADFIGFLAASDASSKRGTRPEDLYDVLKTTMVAMERYLILTRITERLPRKRERSSLELEGSNLLSRMFILNKIILGVIRDEISCPVGVSAFWKGVSEEFLTQISSKEEYRMIEAICQRSNIVARGAIYLGSGSPFPQNLPTPEELEGKYGPLSGNLRAIQVPFELPESMYEINSNSEWEPESGIDPGLAGFACAVRDLTMVLMHPDDVDQDYGTDYLQNTFQKHLEPTKLLRYPRELVVSRQIIPFSN